jgi:hypothetical protein
MAPILPSYGLGTIVVVYGVTFIVAGALTLAFRARSAGAFAEA